MADPLSRQIDALQKRLSSLPPLANGAAEPDSGPTAQTLADLSVALEELRVADEELRQQNEELAAAREMIEVQRRRYHDLFEFAPDAYLVTDAARTIREANRAAGALLNVAQGFLAGKPLDVFIQPEQRDLLGHLVDRLRAGEQRVECQARCCPRDRAAIDVHVAVAAVPGQADRLAGELRWLLRDVTAARQAERLAAIGQTMAGLAHESRNALQRSQACLEMLELQVRDRPRALELAARVRKAQDDMHRLFEGVRSYAAPLVLKRRVLDLGQMLRDAWEDLAWQRTGRAATLEEERQITDLLCAVDRPAIERVFVNVLSNALDACSDPVVIRVTWRPAALRGQAAAQVCIRDSGPGLLPEQRHRIFEPFYTTKTQGTGLGMALARRIVEAHGGRIGVGDHDGPGAEFLITLPRGAP